MIQDRSSRSVLITGGAQGIGAETALVLAERGWSTVIADINLDECRQVARRLEVTHPVEGGHHALGVDVSDCASVRQLCADLGSKVSTLQGLVHAAGVISRQPAEDFDLAQWQRQLNVHLTGAFLTTRGLFSLLLAGSGAVVNIASVGSTFGLPGRIAYSTAKSGILGMTRTLAAEWGPRGVRINAVAPGYVGTEMVLNAFRDGTLDEGRIRARTPLRRLATPREIATAIAFLLSDDSSFVNGAILHVDGGLTINGSFD